MRTHKDLCERDRHFAQVVAEIWEFDLPFDVYDPVQQIFPHNREALDLERIATGKQWVEEGETMPTWIPAPVRSITHYDPHS